MLIPLLLLIPTVSSFDNIVTGCNSRCSIVFDENLDCLQKSLDYNTQVLFGTMRNYVSSQVQILNLSKANNKAQPTAGQMTSSTVDHISKIGPSDQSDEGDVLSSSQAEPIVQALIDNVEDVKNRTQSFAVYCPEGCEKSQSPWTTMFYASLSVNVAFFAVGVSSIFITYWQDVRYAKKVERKLMATPTANGN